MEPALCSGLSPGPGASLQSHKGLAGAESHEVMSTGRRNGLGAGEWEGQPLPATAPHPSKDFHLLNCEQKPKTFDSYRSGGGEKISGRKMRGEGAPRPHGLTGLSTACQKPSSWATPARDCCAPTFPVPRAATNVATRRSQQARADAGAWKRLEKAPAWLLKTWVDPWRQP